MLVIIEKEFFENREIHLLKTKSLFGETDLDLR